MSFQTLVFRASLSIDHRPSCPCTFRSPHVRHVTGSIDAKMLWRIPSTSSHLTVLAFWVAHAENQEVILIYLRIGSDIVISTMASEMVEGEVPGNFLSAATAFWFLLSVS